MVSDDSEDRVEESILVDHDETSIRAAVAGLGSAKQITLDGIRCIAGRCARGRKIRFVEMCSAHARHGIGRQMRGKVPVNETDFAAFNGCVQVQ